jgi:serine phosphatase RsbU (regulator of sigma subunit)
VFAQEPVVIDDTLTSREFGRNLEYVEDKDKKLTIEDIVRKPLKWAPSNSTAISLGFTKSAYWFRFLVINRRTKDNTCYLEIDYPKLDSIILYIPEKNGGFTDKKMGAGFPFYQREIVDRNFMFLLNQGPGQHTYYLRVETTGSLNFKPLLWSSYAFQKRSHVELPLFWIYYGMMMIMVIYNLFIFLSVRNISYIYYSAFISAFIFIELILNGFAFQYLWPNSMWWSRNSLPFFIAVSFVFASLFIRTHLEIPEKFPLINRALIFGTVAPNAIAALFSLLSTYRIGIILTAMLAIYTAVILYVLVSYVLFRGSRPARYILLAFTLNVFGIVVFVLKSFGILPANLLTNWSLQVGYTMVVIFFSFSLADQINVMKNALQYLNENLEKKVEERTVELNAAMKKLIETSSALWGEMELAKKIQTVLLPEKPEIPGYEISAFMRPAVEVGGDYYDIINAGGMNWVVIGDVSGHGISAGLIMMMVQTAINVTLSKNPKMPPSELLQAINMTIKKNIIRLGGDKYVTITALAVFDNGRFHFSGLHQNILIYRSKTRTVESVETEGFWIGIIDDIHGMLRDERLEMNLDDMMLLFTDGITEAWEKGSQMDKRDAEKQMFGENRLVERLSAHGKGKTEDVKNAILDALQEYDCIDDVSMVILKMTG